MTEEPLPPPSPLRRCPACGKHPTGSRWIPDGSFVATLDHEPGCPLPDSQLELTY